MGRLAGEQHLPVGVGEAVRDHLQEPVGRHPAHPVGVVRAEDGAEPGLKSRVGGEILGVVVGPALQVDAPPAGERHEQHVAAPGSRVVIVEHPLRGERVLELLGDVDDDESVGRSTALHRDAQAVAHRRPGPVGGDHVVAGPLTAGGGEWTPSGLVATASTGQFHTNSTPAAWQARSRCASVATWGKLVNGGKTSDAGGG